MTGAVGILPAPVPLDLGAESCLHLARPCAGLVPVRASLLWQAGNKDCSGAWGAGPGLSPGAEGHVCHLWLGPGC